MILEQVDLERFEPGTRIQLCRSCNWQHDGVVGRCPECRSSLTPIHLDEKFYSLLGMDVPKKKASKRTVKKPPKPPTHTAAKKVTKKVTKKAAKKKTTKK